MAIRGWFPLISVLIAFGFAPSSYLYAQGLILTLPPDGTWSRYRLSYQTSEISLIRKPKELPDEFLEMFPTVGFGESELVLSSVGSENIGNAPHRWIELFRKSQKREVLLRLLVPEQSMTHGRDLFDDAVKVLLQDTDSIGGLHGEISDPQRRAYEIERFRTFFPKFSPDQTGNDVVLEADDEQSNETFPHGTVHRFRFGFQGKLFGGVRGVFSHEANYVAIVTKRAPFGVEQLWLTDSVTIEDPGPVELDDEFCDGPGTKSRGSQQVVLMESGNNAVSRFKKAAEQSDASESHGEAN